MNRPQALTFILFLIIQLNYVYSVCTKRNVATVINVDVGNIDLFCNPDEWFHGRINNHIRLKEGMIVSNEPGYYEKNNFGIRIENLIYVKKKKNKKFFENLTMVPIDKDLIEKKLLNKKEKAWINVYHRQVFKNLKGEMSSLEKKELKDACSAI